MGSVAENWLIKMGVKGSDVVLSQFKKIETAKKSFQKKSNLQLTKDSAQHHAKALQRAKQIKNISEQKQRDEKLSQINDKKKIQAEKQIIKDNSAMGKTMAATSKATKTLGGAVLTVAGGMASMSPVDMVRAVAQGGTALAAGLAGGAGNALWGGLGDAAKATIEYFGKLLDTGMQMGAGALNAYKQALPVAAKRASDVSFLRYSRYGENMTAGQASTYTTDERTKIAKDAFLNYGKPTKELSAVLKDLFHTRSNGDVVNHEQAAEIARGNFSAMGNDKGFFLDQIMSSAGGLPPSLKQKMFTGLFKNINQEDSDKGDLLYEGTIAAGYHRKRVEMSESDEKHQQNIVANSDHGTMISLNNNLNALQITMVKNAKIFSDLLSDAAVGVKNFIDELTGDKMRESKAKAAEAIQSGGG